MKRKATDVLADVFIYVFMAVLSLLCLIPFIHVLSVSISGNGAVMSNQVFLIPKESILTHIRRFSVMRQ